MSPSQYLHFIFKFANATAGSSEFLRLLRRHTGNLASVDAVMFEPVVDRRLRADVAWAVLAAIQPDFTSAIALFRNSAGYDVGME